MDFVGDPDGGWRHMRGWCPLRSALRMHSFLAARVEQCEYMRTARSPSESVESPASIKGTLESPCGPRYGRPSDRFGPPTALFSRALALLKKDLSIYITPVLRGSIPLGVRSRFPLPPICSRTTTFQAPEGAWNVVVLLHFRPL